MKYQYIEPEMIVLEFADEEIICGSEGGNTVEERQHEDGEIGMGDDDDNATSTGSSIPNTLAY